MSKDYQPNNQNPKLKDFGPFVQPITERIYDQNYELLFLEAEPIVVEKQTSTIVNLNDHIKSSHPILWESLAITQTEGTQIEFIISGPEIIFSPTEGNFKFSYTIENGWKELTSDISIISIDTLTET